MSLVCFEMQSNLKEKKTFASPDLHFAIVTSFFAQPFSSQNALGGGSDHAENQNGGNFFKKTTQKKIITLVPPTTF